MRAAYGMTTDAPKTRVEDEPSAATALRVRLAAEAAALDTLGRDILTFLAASVVVVPLSKSLKITPVLGFLLLGSAIGPYGLSIFSDSEADVELGDFGILFLLFIEGLQLSPARLERLGSFFDCGFSLGLLNNF